jgi:hypothetical protein
LKSEEKDKAIWCRSEYGPHFGDIGVFDNCNANTYSFTDRFGNSYTNDTGLCGNTFFTGSSNNATIIVIVGISNKFSWQVGSTARNQFKNHNNCKKSGSERFQVKEIEVFQTPN